MRRNQVLAAGPGMADADPDAPKVRTQARIDRAQAIVASSAAANLHLDLERGKVELVVEDGQRIHVELVKVKRLLNCIAAVVHEGLRLQQEHSLAADAA